MAVIVMLPHGAGSFRARGARVRSWCVGAVGAGHARDGIIKIKSDFTRLAKLLLLVEESRATRTNSVAGIMQDRTSEPQ